MGEITPKLMAPEHARIPFAELVSALSFALDLTGDAVPGHALRTCLLAMRIAAAAGLPEGDRTSLFYASLLKDAGCSSNAGRISQITGSDERQVKRIMRQGALADGALTQLRTLYGVFWPGNGAYTRLRRLAGFAAQRREHLQQLTLLRCERGASVLERIGMGQQAAEAVRYLDETWNGAGFPSQLAGNTIPLLSRILLLAQFLDVFRIARGQGAAIDMLQEQSGRTFDPELVKVAVSLHREGSLWRHSTMPDARLAALDLEPGRILLATPEQVDQVCEAFAEVVDIKSRYTAIHSRRVAALARDLGRGLHLPAERLQLLTRAALLHDLGKLSVPNSILDKPGELTPAEWKVVRAHPHHTTQILSRVLHFAELALIAGQHHERLDGSGYPHRLRAEDLSLESRLLAVADHYAALREDRSYRRGLTHEEAMRLLQREAGTRLDAASCEALQDVCTDSLPSSEERRSA